MHCLLGSCGLGWAGLGVPDWLRQEGPVGVGPLFSRSCHHPVPPPQPWVPSLPCAGVPAPLQGFSRRLCPCDSKPQPQPPPNSRLPDASQGVHRHSTLYSVPNALSAPAIVQTAAHCPSPASWPHNSVPLQVPWVTLRVLGLRSPPPPPGAAAGSPCARLVPWALRSPSLRLSPSGFRGGGVISATWLPAP